MSTTAPGSARLPEASVRKTGRAVLSLSRPRLRTFLAVIVLFTLGSGTALAVPALQGRVVDDVIAGLGLTRLSLTVGGIVLSGAVAALLILWGGRLLVAALQATLAELREEVLDAALHLDAGDVETAGSSDVVSRVTGDVESVTGAVTDVLPRATQALFTLGVTAVGFAVLDPWLALAALVALPVQILSGAVFLRRSRPLYVRQQRMDAERGQALIETVNGAATVRAHAQDEARLALIAERSLASVTIGRSATKVRNVFNGGLNSAEFLGLAAILAMGFWRVDSGMLTVGAATAGALLFQRIFAPVNVLLAGIDDLQRAEVGLARLVGVLQAERATVPSRTIQDTTLVIDDVSLRYPGSNRQSLDHVSLSVPAGSRVVLVGASGSGKSTLAQLIAGVLRPDDGTVLIGGVDAPAASSSSGRPATVLVTQEIHQFSGTVANNLRLAAPDATDEDLRTALDTVHADWTDQFDLGHEGPLDESAVQQLALARVLLADPPVVVLDEATAYARSGDTGDAGGTGVAGVEAVTAGRTSVVVAHHLSQVENADLVVVLESGRIVESGTHGELTELGGRYAQLWAAWRSSTR